MNQQGHQGDVQFKTVKIPKKVKSIKKRPLAYGEKSGHQHVVTGDYEMFEDEKSNLYVVVGPSGATLRHIHESNFKGFDKDVEAPVADHKNIKLKPGSSLVFGIHQKYEPFAKTFEKVID